MKFVIAAHTFHALRSDCSALNKCHITWGSTVMPNRQTSFNIGIPAIGSALVPRNGTGYPGPGTNLNLVLLSKLAKIA
eukprot:3745072-Rhodomonas_salina.2